MNTKSGLEWLLLIDCFYIVDTLCHMSLYTLQSKTYSILQQTFVTLNLSNSSVTECGGVVCIAVHLLAGHHCPYRHMISAFYYLIV